ncbi:hypothetical protein ACFPM1_00195 [Halorubrum rubrum]|uniref:Uncharacterized protein n=1 Tax=Halorubrum rubrum TaxID=1126240 RepID=A0ABD5QWX1_9EURY|nr:hypothetical protein [Halorubrum rubrum]
MTDRFPDFSPVALGDVGFVGRVRSGLEPVVDVVALSGLAVHDSQRRCS